MSSSCLQRPGTLDEPEEARVPPTRRILTDDFEGSPANGSVFGAAAAKFRPGPRSGVRFGNRSRGVEAAERGLGHAQGGIDAGLPGAAVEQRRVVRRKDAAPVVDGEVRDVGARAV